MQVTLTGEVTVSEGGRAVSERQLGGRRARLMLAVLVLERPRAVPVDELAEVLWPGGPPASWQASLREVASRVRVALETVGLDGGDVLRGAFGCYQLRLPEGARVDVEEARAGLHRAERRLAEGDARRAAELAEAAATVARRPLLGGDDSEWVQGERARLHADLVRAWEIVAGARLALREPLAAAAAAEHVIALEPFREGARITLMRAQAATGSPAEALRTYESWRRFLADELGVDPSPEAQHLYRSLLAGAAGPGEAGAEAASVTATPPSRRRLPGALGASWRAPFVNRNEELRLVRARVGAAATRGSGVLLISGEAGMGKTRLCAEAAADFAGNVLYGRCDPDPLVPFQPLVEALDGWLEGAPDDVRDALMASHGAALRRLLPWLASAVAPEKEGGPGEERHRLVAAATAVFAAAAPVLVVLDDLHWADQGTLSLLPHLARRVLAGEGAVLVGAFRHDESSPDLDVILAALRREEDVLRVALEGLDERAIVELISAIGDGPVGADQAAALLRQTGGNPFYLGELLRRGGLADPSAAPLGVREVVTGRAARLSPAARSLVEAAAVVGSEFSLRVVGAASGLAGEGLRDAVGEAQDNGLIAAEAGASRYRFVHEIVRAALYDGISAGRRAGLHRRVARALEDAGSERQLGVLAHHWARGAPGDARAVKAARAAAEAAMASYAYEDAARLYEQALDHLDGNDESAATQRAELLVALGGAYKRAGKTSHAERYLREAADMGRRLDSADLVARAALTLTGRDRIRPTFNPATFALLQEAVAVTAGEQSRRRVTLLSRLVAYQENAEPTAELEAATQEAMEIGERLGGDAVLADALSARLHALSGPGHALARLRVADRLAEVADRLGDDELGLVALDHRVWALVEVGQAEAARTAMDAYRQRAHRSRLPEGPHFSAHHDCFRTIAEGRFADAEEAVDRLLGLLRPVGQLVELGGKLMHLSVLRWLQGRLGELEADVHRIAHLLPPTVVEPALALLAAETGRREVALEHLNGFMDRYGPRPLAPHAMWPGVAFRLATTCARLQATEHAGNIYDALAPYAGMVCCQQAFVFYGAYDLHLGRLAALERRWDDACEHLAAALTLHSEMRARPWTALTQHLLADVLTARGRARDARRARELRAQAADTARAVGLGLDFAPAAGPR